MELKQPTMIHRKFFFHHDFIRVSLLAVALVLSAMGARAASPNALKISCFDRGIYKVTGQDLKDAGADLTAIDTKKMALVHYREAVPLQPGPGLDDGRFDVQDAFFFFSAGGLEDNVNFMNVWEDFKPVTQDFILHFQGGGFEPLRYRQTRLKTPAKADVRKYPVSRSGGRMHFEQNPIWEFFDTTHLTKDRTDYIFWAKMTQPSTTQSSSGFSTEFQLPRAQNDQPSTLTALLFGVADAYHTKINHQVAIDINGENRQVFEWEGLGECQAVMSLPPNSLRRGTNKINFQLLREDEKPGVQNMEINVVMLDWFRLDYTQTTELFNGYNEFHFAAAPDNESRAFQISGLTGPEAILLDPLSGQSFQVKTWKLKTSSIFHEANLTLDSREHSLAVSSADSCKKPLAMEPLQIGNVFGDLDDSDFLILSHPDFIEDLGRFVEWKQSRGLKVKLVNIMDLINEETGGYATPVVMHDYIKALYTSQSQPRLRYVLLVGDSATVSKYKSYCPAYAYLDSGTHANDNYFANFTAPDATPLMAVGRFSVRTHEQLNHAIDKVIAYENGTNLGIWHARFLMIAASLGWARKDAGRICDDYIRPDYMIQYMQTNDRAIDPDYHKRLTEELVGYFDAGQLVTVFFGHGGGTVWEIGPTILEGNFHKHLFDQVNVGNLTNYVRQSLVFALTCYTNDFDNPYKAQTLGETFVNSPGGAIAVIGAATRSSINLNYSFLDRFFKNLAERRRTRLGDIFVDTKCQVNIRSANESYLLLGDPTLEFRLPDPAIEITALEWDGAARSLSFDYRLPEGTALPARVEYLLTNDEEKVVGHWTGMASDLAATGNYTIVNEDAIKGNRDWRLVVYLAHGPEGDYVGGEVFKASAAATVAAQTE